MLWHTRLSFKIREYGGINYNTDLDDSDSNFKISTFDYALQIEDADQYLQIPLGDIQSKTDSIAIEMKLSVGNEFLKTQKIPLSLMKKYAKPCKILVQV